MSRPYIELPPIENAFYDDRGRYQLHPELFFVFGSNLAGIHGAGAALDALNQYGAQYGIGDGFCGKSYAIPTKDSNIRTLPLSVIKNFVTKFVDVTNDVPDVHYQNRFFVTAIGTGLAGYRHDQIAPMFRGCINCWLPMSWKSYLT
jgi:hypothetical protein